MIDSAALSFADSARAAKHFEDEFIKFLKNALKPPLSTNASDSRNDIDIQYGIVNAAPQNHKILDLCCGWPLFLEKLIIQLRSETPRQGEYHYVACDVNAWQEEFKRELSTLEEKANGLGVKVYRLFADVSEPTLRDIVRAVYKEPFDVILFSNALHEIPPRAVPELLFTLISLLEDHGQLVILDPDPDWFFDTKRWVNIEHLHRLPIDWEANGVWLPPTLYGDMLEKFGCSVKVFRANDSQTFYVLQAHRGTFDISKRVQLIEEAKEMLKQVIKIQLQTQVDRYIQCRKDLMSHLDLGEGEKKRLLYKAVEFFTICASQARRVEVKQELW